VYGILASLLEELSDAGRLRVDDPRLAAQQFAWLVMGVPLDRGMFLPPAEAAGGISGADLADAAVRVFLAAYGVRDR